MALAGWTSEWLQFIALVPVATHQNDTNVACVLSRCVSRGGEHNFVGFIELHAEVHGIVLR